jgi:hypothetical protein
MVLARAVAPERAMVLVQAIAQARAPAMVPAPERAMAPAPERATAQALAMVPAQALAMAPAPERAMAQALAMAPVLVLAQGVELRRRPRSPERLKQSPHRQRRISVGATATAAKAMATLMDARVVNAVI